MTRRMLNRYTSKGLRRALFAGASAGVMGSAAWAQISSPAAPLSLETKYLGYSASVSPRVTVTDNVGLDQDGFRDDDVILSTLFTAGAIASTPRVTAIGLGDIDVAFLSDDDEYVVNQNVGVASTFTAADNWVFVDVSGQSSRQFLGDNARFSHNVNAARNQRINVHSYSVSPYVYHRMADQSAVELRYRFSQAFIDDDDADANFFGTDFLNDSTSHEATASYESGGLYDRVRFRLAAYGADYNESGSDQLPQFEFEQGTILGEAQYALSRNLFLSGAVGYDEVNAQEATALFFDEDDLSGVLWRAGLTAQGRRSRLRVEYGERYGDGFIDAELFYELSNRIIASGGATRTFRSRTQGLNTRFRETQTRVLDFADALREGQTLSPRSVVDEANEIANVFAGAAAQTVGVGVTDTAFLSMAGRFDQTTLTVSGFFEDSEFGFRDLKAYSAALNLNHRLSRQLAIYGRIDFRRANTTVSQSTCQANPVLFGLNPSTPAFDPVASCAALVNSEGRTNTVNARVGAAHSIYKNVSLFGEYSHAERFSPTPELEYAENVGTVGLTLDF